MLNMQIPQSKFRHKFSFYPTFLLLGLTLQFTAAAEPITIKGSSTVFPVCKEAAAEFARVTKKIVFCDGGGSEFGIKYAKEGGVGMISRRLSEPEISSGLSAFVIGYDGIAIIVNAKSKAKKLSFDQIKLIFSGKIKNWSELGFENSSIVVAGTNKDHGTYNAFIDLTGLKQESKNPDGTIVRSDLIQTDFHGFQSHNAVINFVAKEKNSIGFIPIGFLESSASNTQIKGIAINTSLPNLKSVRNKTYPLVRPLSFVYLGDSKQIPSAFFEFVLSESGRKILNKNNFVPEATSLQGAK